MMMTMMKTKMKMVRSLLKSMKDLFSRVFCTNPLSGHSQDLIIRNAQRHFNI